MSNKSKEYNVIRKNRANVSAVLRGAVACYLLYYLLHVALSWWVHKGMVYDILQQFLWLGIVSVVSLVTVALTDLFWIRMGLLAALLGVCALWALRHRDQVARTLAVFRRKSA